MPPEVAGWRRVTVETAPLAERIQTARGPCCEKDIILDAISCTRMMEYWNHYLEKKNYDLNNF